MSEAALDAQMAPASDSVSAARRGYILFVLTLVGTLNYLDRQVLTILLEPIRKDLHLTDTHIGFLTGIAFTFVYVGLAVPAARLADNWSRRKVIALAIGAWSVMTALCGVAQSFTQLLLARMGVGVGEAGGHPSCTALVGDLFPKAQRSLAMGIFLLSMPLGIGLGLLIGGLAVGALGWRGVFVLVAAPGVLIAPVVWLTIPEVRQGLSDGIQEQLANPPLLKTVRLLLSFPSYRNMVLAQICASMLGLGISLWLPSFLARSHGMTPSQIGAYLSIGFAVPFGVGLLGGGRLTDWMGRRDVRWYFWLPAIATFINGIAAACAFLAPTAYVFWFMAIAYLAISSFIGPNLVITQTLSPIAFRATACAFTAFMVNTIGLGIGPQAMGVVSDLLRPAYGEESLRMSLLLVTTLSIPATFFYYRASRTYRADMAAADAHNNA
jgi:MFS family permease